MMKKSEAQVTLLPAGLKEYPIIQNMARFYVYDLSRECGQGTKDWALPPDGLYEAFDFKDYFNDPKRKALLIQCDDEMAGFILLNQECTSINGDWNMGEFFIIARFKGKGVGQSAAFHVWSLYPGQWEVSVIPENKSALAFWRKVISHFTADQYTEEVKMVDFDPHQPKRIILSFQSKRFR